MVVNGWITFHLIALIAWKTNWIQRKMLSGFIGSLLALSITSVNLLSILAFGVWLGILGEWASSVTGLPD